MRILFLLTRANLGGVSKYLANLTRALMDQGDEVLIVMGEVQGAEIEDPDIAGLPILKIPSMGREISLLGDIKSLGQWRKIVKEFQPDIIHSHMSKAGFISRIPSKSFYRKNGDPVRVHTFHGHSFSEPEFQGLKRLVFLAIEKKLANRVDALVSAGEQVKRELRELKIINKKYFVSIPPGVKFPKLKSRISARNQFGISESEFVVAWIGRMASVKNPELVLHIAQELRDVTFIMAGGGELLERIKAKAPKNVKVIGWADSGEVLSACDLVLLTSYHEAIPLVLIEAHLAGKPAVSTNVGGVSEVVINKETGFLGEESTLAEYIDKLLKSSQLREEMGEKAKVRAKELFTIDQMAKKHKDLYLELLKGNRK